MDTAQQAEAILELRNQAGRKPNEPSRYDKDNKPLRVKIDAKLSEMSDEAFIASMTEYDG
jgi:hypothetical protein